ncbi:PREDICTED: KH domain-containing protein C56G2.1 isoform X2 [Vollenhovia emeryi]|uniref:KH domain-containing protein C56G2.1 isoform X2 n=1 Tax=Vollenhovia emeryi TaxID=411798 RepID=UPI0005F3AC43|nr:PREDICTED: KH domain-containing protein C56G2.1 isoform X2 [Vollenhovia emeryi]
MNPPVPVQLMKWAVPAVALAVVYYWYKHRRIDRGEQEWDDTGGTAESNRGEKAISNEAAASFRDSDVQEKLDQGSSISCCNYTRQEEPTRVPRKVSESMDIPFRNSTSQSTFFSSSQIRYDVDSVEATSPIDVELGSNPSASYLEMFGTNASTKRSSKRSSSRSIGNGTKTIQDVPSGQEQTLHCETEPREQNATDEYSRKEDEQQSEGHTIGAQGQEADERDSANHSPVSVVLDGSVTDEAESEGSNTDSGKGGSINGYKKDNTPPSTYEFAIPQHLAGRLIGRLGCFLQSIRTKTNVVIRVIDNPCDGDHKICSIRGSVEGIKIALKMIRQKFPEKRFPQVTLADISTVPEVNVEVAYNVLIQWPLSLVEGVNNDINISHIVKPNWLFVQLPTHPSFPLLQNLEDNMTFCYNNELLPVPDVLNRGDYVAVYWCDKWVRGYIERPDPSGERHLIRLLDNGGYWPFSNSQCRPLLYNYLSLPFQAIEVFLAKIQPKNGKWSAEAYNVVQSCSSKGVAQAQIEGRIQTNIYTNIYFMIQNYGLISLTEELVMNGHAEQIAWEQMKPETLESICT